MNKEEYVILPSGLYICLYESIVQAEAPKLYTHMTYVMLFGIKG